MPAKAWIALFGVFVFCGVLLFGSAGTIDWPAAWSYLVLTLAGNFCITFMLARHDPALLAERMKIRPQKDQPIWDRIFLATLQVIWCGWVVLMGLDSVRFRWSTVPLWIQWIAAVCVILSYWIMYRVFRENTFLAPVVKIQKDRGHRVISTGPYALVRHPLYAAALLMIPTSALMLGSWYGLAASSVFVAGICYRAVMEERELRKGLEGYKEYTQRVRYRMIPFVW